MGIRFRCPDCGKKIHVKDFLAGKRGICPKCEAGVDIPLVSQLPPSRKKSSKKSKPAEPDDLDDDFVESPSREPLGRLIGASEFPTVDPLLEFPGRRWYAASPDGREVGPLSVGEVRAMIDVGDIRAESSVRRDDWPQKMMAAAVWPYWKGADPFALPYTAGGAVAPRNSLLDANAGDDADDGADLDRAGPSARKPPRSAPSSPIPVAQPVPVDSPTLNLPPAVGQAIPASAPLQSSSSPFRAPPQPLGAETSRAPAAPQSATPTDSASPDPGLYYSRLTNFLVLFILALVVAVLTAAAYRLIVDPPAWLRSQQSGISAGRSIVASLASYQRNRS
jgi:hypothetical protein